MLTDTQRQQLRSWLEAERDRLKAVLGHLEDEAHSLSEDEAAEGGSLGNHPADVGTDVSESEQVFALEGAEEELLDLVERALGRMDAGSYGACERCGRAIAVERLEALPYATLCVDCQAEVEREQQ